MQSEHAVRRRRKVELHLAGGGVVALSVSHLDQAEPARARDFASRRIELRLHEHGIQSAAVEIAAELVR